MSIGEADTGDPLGQSEHVYPVLLCGGSGTRLWPLSRPSCPKQFLALGSDDTLLQATAGRAGRAVGPEPPLVLCGKDQRFLVAEQLEAAGIVPAAIICEPMARNTGPALAVAAMYLRERDPDAILVALPSDHHIGDDDVFREALGRAATTAFQGRLVCFGIKPTHPETGYGYIERGAPLNDNQGVFAIARFVEKPDRKTAQEFLSDGTYLWNSGMFVLPASGFLDEFQRHDPTVVAACAEAFERRKEESGCVYPDADSFGSARSVSVDYAVMERTDRAAVVPADMIWSDLGSWRSLRDIGPRDQDGNVLQGDVRVSGVRDSLIRSNGRLVAAIGVEGVVVVETADAVLVGSADRAAEVGRLVKQLKADGRTEAEVHKRVHRPWGYFEAIDAGDRFQVKHICVRPGRQLSLQMHHHRSEHWVVVSGTARIECDGESRLLGENDSSFIPLGATHRLENPGRLDLHLIEIQLGAYLGEDDIVRFEDNYGRL